MKAPLIVSALEDAAKRGVNVQVGHDELAGSWKPSFDALKAAGAHVRTYKNSSKTLYIHAKIIAADAGRVFLGSENFSVGLDATQPRARRDHHIGIGPQSRQDRPLRRRLRRGNTLVVAARFRLLVLAGIRRRPVRAGIRRQRALQT